MSEPARRAATGAPRRRPSDRVATLLVRLRWLVIACWLGGAAAAWFLLPSLSETGGRNELAGLVPEDAPAIAAELRSVELFGFPLSGRTVVVQRDPGGLSVYDQARTVANAAAAVNGEYGELPALRGALPITNTLGVFPSSQEQGTTALTFLLFDPEVSLGTQRRSAQEYIRRGFTARDSVVGVTGSVPARAEQGDRIREALPTIELLTLAAIVLIVGVAFGSVVAPVVTVLTAGVAYVVTLRTSGAVADLAGVSPPSELEPVVVALLLGVVTDYTVFFFAALRREVDAGAERLDAARAATASYGRIVAVAGFAVAAGTAALMVAESLFFRALGPALVFTVLMGLVVALSLVPALLAVLGRWTFWPSRSAAGVRSGAGSWFRPALQALAHRRKAAAGVMGASVAVLALAAAPLTGLDLGVSFVGSLPADSGVRQAASAARDGFAPGILSPTTVLVEESGVDERRRALARFGRLLARQPGVAGVLGPGDNPVELDAGVFLARSGDAARFLVVLDDPALGAAAIDSVAALQERLSGLLESAGLDGVEAGVAGDTAAAAFIVQQTRDDLLRIAVAALGANVLMLLLFLRAPVAAVVLLLGSVLSLAASLGLTMLLFGSLDPGAGLTFYVPFAAAVLLLAFGSDYNIFTVGNIWEEARHRSMPEAIVAAMPGSVRALLVAGLALAASFGLLAVVPLVPFRQLAFVMCVGILLDVLVVRALLVPALLTVFGRLSAWPRRQLMAASSTRRGDGS